MKNKITEENRMESTITMCTGCEVLSKEHEPGDKCQFCDGGKMVAGNGFCNDCKITSSLEFYNAEVDPPLVVCAACGQFVYEDNTSNHK